MKIIYIICTNQILTLRKTTEVILLKNQKRYNGQDDYQSKIAFESHQFLLH